MILNLIFLKVSNLKHLAFLMFSFPLYLLYISVYELIIIIEIITELHSLQNSFTSIMSCIWSSQEHCDKQGDEGFIHLYGEGRNLWGGSYANVQ